LSLRLAGAGGVEATQWTVRKIEDQKRNRQVKGFEIRFKEIQKPRASTYIAATGVGAVSSTIGSSTPRSLRTCGHSKETDINAVAKAQRNTLTLLEL
jgi:hypothetical protein